MSGSLPGKGSVAAGVVLLPATGNNRALFFVAAGLMTAGVITLIASALVARKQAKQEA